MTIGSGVTYIGGYIFGRGSVWAFAGCASLTNFTVDTLNPAYSSLDGVLFNKSQDTLIAHPQGKRGGYIVPSGVTSIGARAFEDCTGLTSVAIPNSVTNLGYDAFSSCTGLTSVYFAGDAPNDGLVILGASNATVYYLPGTTGWSSTFTDCPAALWNPLIQVGDGGFGVRAGGFGFNIAGTPDIPIVVEASTNLATGAWVPLQTLTLTNGLVSFSDPEWTNYPARFYRIRSP